MDTGKKVLTMSDIKNRDEAKRLIIGDGRYTTRGNPRSGGIATVYRATDVDTGKTVAIKVFKTGNSSDGVIEESFRREVQALSDLNHENIVKIYDSGRDEDLEIHYIVMEWVERDLSTVLKEKPYACWDEFFNSIGREILSGLVFAYSRSIAHRDIKPSNILVTEEGNPKICDFGISKIRNFLAPGVTLSQFSSAPYSPPEIDDGTYTYSRDVFGFAALSVASMLGKFPNSISELLQSLEEINADESIRRLLRSCLSTEDPSARPQNVMSLQSEIMRILPVKKIENRKVLLFGVTNNVRKVIEFDIGIREDQIDRFIERDLDEPFFDEISATPERPEKSFRVYGNKYSYTAKIEESQSKLLLVNALEFSQSDLDKKRAQSCHISLDLRVSKSGGATGKDAINDFIDEMTEFSSNKKIRAMEEREQEIYSTWLNLLSAKTDLEKQKRVNSKYKKYEISGAFLKFEFPEDFDVDIFIDKEIKIESDSKRFVGSVVSISKNTITVKPNDRNKLDYSFIPLSGKIEIDTKKSDVALEKQKKAVDQVRYGKSVNPRLGHIIIRPNEIEVPSICDVEFMQSHIDEDKKEAVRVAVSGPEIMLVEGPPGTGKTTFITEVVLQTLRINPSARILLTSQTHVALDNSLERIVGIKDIDVRAIRIGSESDDRISPESKKLMLEHKLPLMRMESIDSGKRFIEQWAESRGIDIHDINKAMALERRAGIVARKEVLQGKKSEFELKLDKISIEGLDAEQISEINERYVDISHELDELATELKNSAKELSSYFKDEAKDFTDSTSSELREWAYAFSNDTEDGRKLKKLLSVHSEWEAIFGRGWEFKSAVIASSQIVAGTCLGVMGVPGKDEIKYDLCIVDEASIASPTEALVPMSRARKSLLVGDNNQLSPFQDPELKSSGLLDKYNLNDDKQKITLFKYLSELLPKDLCKTLTTQHRMDPAIGNLISECFYGGSLKSVDRERPSHFKRAQEKAVIWHSTSKLSNRASKKLGTSHFNELEISEIIKIISRVDFQLKNGKEKNIKISLAILTGYGEQKNRIKNAISSRSKNWSSFASIFVNVVDAFQGQEADMVIFSVTRSEADGLGFLREMERINVALSRAKELLAIVGDSAYCFAAGGDKNPLRTVIDYIRRNPQTCALEELTQ